MLAESKNVQKRLVDDEHPPVTPRLTVAIATRNRPDHLARCLRSLEHLAHLSPEVLLVDDASDEPVHVPAGLAGGALPVRLIRHRTNTGYIAARNEMAALAKAPYVLSVDDDAYFTELHGIERAIAVLDSDPSVGAVALHQWKSDDVSHAPFMQPSKGDYPRFVPGFGGYGHLLRKNLFLELGGYRERFGSYGEEGEFCKRMLDAGYSVVCLPDAHVVHTVATTARQNTMRYRMNSCRNACLAALYNEPLPLLAATIPLRLASFGWALTRDPGEAPQTTHPLQGIVQELWREASAIWPDRKALGWSTYRRWEYLKRVQPRYSIRNGVNASEQGAMARRLSAGSRTLDRVLRRELARSLAASVEGWLSDREGERLFELAATCDGSGAIVEIGSWKGRSTVWIAAGARGGPTSSVFAIDPHEGSLEDPGANTLDELRSNLERTGIADMVKPIVARSYDAARDFNETIEFLFIDGNHEEEVVERDIADWIPRVVPGGSFAMHDILTRRWPGPRRAFRRLLWRSKDLSGVAFVDSLAYGRKVSANTFGDRLRNRALATLLAGYDAVPRMVPSWSMGALRKLARFTPLRRAR